MKAHKDSITPFLAVPFLLLSCSTVPMTAGDN